MAAGDGVDAAIAISSAQHQQMARTILGRPRWHVAKTGNDTNDGKSYATAKLTIAGAVAVCTVGDEIVVWPNATAYTAAVNLSALVGIKLTIMPGATVGATFGSTITLGEEGELTGGGLITALVGNSAVAVYEVNNVSIHDINFNVNDWAISLSTCHNINIRNVNIDAEEFYNCQSILVENGSDVFLRNIKLSASVPTGDALHKSFCVDVQDTSRAIVENCDFHAQAISGGYAIGIHAIGTAAVVVYNSRIRSVGTSNCYDLLQEGSATITVAETDYLTSSGTITRLDPLVDSTGKVPATVAAGDGVDSAIAISSAQHQKTAREVYGVTGVFYHVSYNASETMGNDGLSWATADLTAGPGVKTDVEAAASGDLVQVGSGTFDMGNASATVPDGVSLLGKGKDQTTITGSALYSLFSVGAGCSVRDVTFAADPANSAQVPLAGSNGLNCERVRTIGDGDGFIGTGPIRLSDCEADAKEDTANIDATLLEISHSRFSAIGPSATGANLTRAFVVQLEDCCGYIRKSSLCVARNGGGTTRGIEVYGTGTLFILDDTNIVADDTGNHTANGLYVHGAVNVIMMGGSIRTANGNGTDLAVNNTGTGKIVLIGVDYDRTKTSNTGGGQIIDIPMHSLDANGAALATAALQPSYKPTVDASGNAAADVKLVKTVDADTWQASFIAAIWSVATSALTGVGSIGKWMLDTLLLRTTWTDTKAGYVDVSISSRGTSTLAAGAKMDLVDAPSATAIASIKSNLGTIPASGNWNTVTPPDSTAIQAAAAAALTAYNTTGVAKEASVGGVLTAIQNVQNNTFIGTNIPQILERPDTGSKAVVIRVVFNDETGTPKNLDSGNPIVALVDEANTDLSSRLGTWTNPATGEYAATYTNTNTDSIATLDWNVTGTVNSKLRRWVGKTQIVDTTAVDFTAADRTKLEAAYNKLPSKAYLAGTDTATGVLDTVPSGGATATAVGNTLQATDARLPTIGKVIAAVDETGALPAAAFDNQPAASAEVDPQAVRDALALSLSEDVTPDTGSIDTDLANLIAAEAAILSSISSADNTIISPLSTTLDLTLIRCDDYLSGSSHGPISWTNSNGTWGGGNLSTYTATFSIGPIHGGTAVLTTEATIISPTDSQIIQVELSSAQTALLTSLGKSYKYQLRMDDLSGYRDTEIEGIVTVRDTVDPPPVSP